MPKTEFCKPLTIEVLVDLHDKYGMVVEINDGEVASSHFE